MFVEGVWLCEVYPGDGDPILRKLLYAGLMFGVVKELKGDVRKEHFIFLASSFFLIIRSQTLTVIIKQVFYF